MENQIVGIRKLEIENFKSIKKLEIELNNRLNIFIGANGSGKSNFINFLKFFRKIYEQNLQAFIAQNGGADKLLYNGIKGSQYIRTRIDFNNAWSNYYRFKLELTANNTLIFREEYSGHKKNEVSLFSNGNLESNIKNDESYRNKYLSPLIESLKIFHFQDTSFTSLMRFPSDLSNNLSLEENGSNLPSILYKIEQNHPELLSEIEALVGYILPSFHSFVLVPDGDRIALRWKMKNIDTIFSAHQFSDGTLRFIALLTLLYSSQDNEVIIMDEPELGLHPKAIHLLTDLLKIKSEKNQILISTQSSDLLNAIMNVENVEEIVNSIFVTEYIQDQTVIKRLEFDQLKNWLEDYSLADLWAKNIFGGNP